MKDIKLGKRIVGKNHKPFIIAEMSGNHNHDLSRALEIVEAASEAGCDALKLQTYTADTMTINVKDNSDFVINDKGSLWDGNNLYSLYKEAYTPWEWHKEIKEKCDQLGLEFFSTPFDSTAVDFLEELGVEFYKLASFENTDIPLIKKIAQTGKPIIASTGMASVADLELLIKTANENGCKDLILLKCTSSYPSDASNANLRSIPHMREMFNTQIGLSDHSMGLGVAVASVVYGATIIEKHFTLSRAEGGVDSDFSMEKDEMKQLVEECNRAHSALGKVNYGTASNNEEKSKQFRRSIYIISDVKKGEILTEKNIKVIRPGLSLAPMYYADVLGKKVKKNLSRGNRVSLQDIEV